MKDRLKITRDSTEFKMYSRWFEKLFELGIVGQEDVTKIVDFFEKEVEAAHFAGAKGMYEAVKLEHRKLLGSVEENDFWRMGYNTAKDNVDTRARSYLNEGWS